jgi:cytochrome oxidase Cu insertion factor (SCO1/SenC/PrrC family)
VPGMNSGLNPSDPILVAAFRSALLHQGLIAAGLLVLLWVLWGASRNWTLASGAGGGTFADAAAAGTPEASARTLLRIGFGLLWLFDGVLQAQPQMAGGLPSQVIQPTAQSSPGWVQHLVNWGGTIWSYHPVQAGAASVWIQAGIGIWLLAASRGWWSRAAGLASAGWGLAVWVFGESFGGIFAPGLSWMTGAPGAVLLYCAAGGLIALPSHVWRTPLAGRLLLAGTGLFWAGMALLQAWPGRGSWQGGADGNLASMAQDMSQTPQPHPLSALVAAFGSFAAAHGFAVNLFLVIALAAAGIALCTGRPRVAAPAVIAGTVLCLADWVLVQDLGFWGGLGTDPNSMPPMILLLWAGYLAVTRLPAAAAEPATGTERTVAAPARARLPTALDWLRPAAIRARLAASSAGTVTALGAAGVVLVGAAPMAAASVNPNADPVIARAIAGDSPPLNLPAPGFDLVSQHGTPVSLGGLRGKVVLLTFLDPVCTTDCPLIAQELKAAGRLLGTRASQVELVAIVANPTYTSTAFTQAFSRQEGMDTVPDWLYLTGPLTRLRQIWQKYGITVQNLPAGAMSAHNDVAFVIDRTGHIRTELGDDPGPGTTSTKSSFAVLLAGYARQALSQS